MWVTQRRRSSWSALWAMPAVSRKSCRYRTLDMNQASAHRAIRVQSEKTNVHKRGPDNREMVTALYV